MGDVAMSIPERIGSLGLLKPLEVVAVPSAPTFDSPQAAWFGAIYALTARHRGERLPSEVAAMADAVALILDRLYRQRRIELAHARVLRVWGERGEAPNAEAPHEREDARLWAEAMERLQAPLRTKGIVQ